MNHLSTGHNGPSATNDPAHPQSRRWLRWGAAVLAADLIVHTTAAALVNDWEGWANGAQNFAFILVTGIVIVGLTYGLLVRWGLKPSPHGRNRAALAALCAGAATLASYAIVFTWAPVLIAPAALVLATDGLRSAHDRSGRGFAITGAALAVTSLIMAVYFALAVTITGNFPFGL